MSTKKIIFYDGEEPKKGKANPGKEKSGV